MAGFTFFDIHMVLVPFWMVIFWPFLLDENLVIWLFFSNLGCVILLE
jgi:hypothetical protein